MSSPPRIGKAVALGMEGSISSGGLRELVDNTGWHSRIGQKRVMGNQKERHKQRILWGKGEEHWDGATCDLWREWEEGELGCMCSHADDRRHDTSDLNGYNYECSYHVCIPQIRVKDITFYEGCSHTGHGQVQVVNCGLSIFLVQPIGPSCAIARDKVQNGMRTYKWYQMTKLWLQ